jgi:uncharacterized protein YbjT (DUF2867 family)
MYAITGAPGNTGKVISKILLEKGKRVRAIGRNAEKIKDLTKLGAESAIGDLNDENFLTKAFSGVTAIYAMIPPNFQAENYRVYQNKMTEAHIAATKKAGIKNVVTLSSVGAHLPEKAGVVQGLYDMEQKWNAVDGVNVLHLRPSYFMENTLGQVGIIKNMGIMGSPIKGDFLFPMVATKDIGELAAKRLLALDFKGVEIQYVLGPRDVSYNEAARIFGKAIGKPDLKYVEFSYEDTKKAMMTSWGLNENGADAFIEFMKSINNGLIFEDIKRTEQNTTSTSIEDFAQTFAYVYNM